MPRLVASLGPCRWIGVPFHSSSPAVGSQIPEMVLMRVDLPAPLSPTRAVTWPSGISRSRSARAPGRSSSLSRAAEAVACPSGLPRLRHLRRLLSPLGRPSDGPSAHDHPEIPAAVQAALYADVQSCDAGTNLSAITVVFIFAGVTHVGTKSTDGTCACSVESVVLPLTRADGGASPARMYIASAAAAWASR